MPGGEIDEAVALNALGVVAWLAKPRPLSLLLTGDVSEVKGSGENRKRMAVGEDGPAVLSNIGPWERGRSGLIASYILRP